MGMDELATRRRQRAKTRLPSVETILEMFKLERAARFRVPNDREVLVEARRRIRDAAKQFGRTVETHYVKNSGVMFGIVPLIRQEEGEAEKQTSGSLRRLR